MFQSRLFWRIFLTQIVLLVLVSAALYGSLSRRYEQVVLAEQQKTLQTYGQLLLPTAKALLQGEEASAFPTAIQAITDNEEIRISLFNSEAEPIGKEGSGSSKLHPAWQTLSPEETRHYSAGEDNAASGVLIQRVGNADETLGFLQLELAGEAGLLMNGEVSSSTGMIFVGAFFVSALAAMFLAARITSPIEKLTEASRNISEGKLYEQVHIQSSDEMERLAEAFNTMSQDLGNRIRELQTQGQLLRENSERLATVLGGMVEGVIAVDSRDRILFANEAAFRMIEFDQRRAVGRPYWEVFRNFDVQNVVRDVVSGQYQLQREILIPRTQARIAFIASRLPGDPCPGVVLVLHDVSELRRLERVRSEFVSNVGHELKTPLAAIQACTETLADGALEDPDHAQHFLTQIKDHADRLHLLILDLMELAKIESEEDLFSKEPIDIGIPIQEAIDEHYSVAATKNIRISQEPTIDELIVKADANAIRTLMNNLLGNAINYTPEGGTVSVAWWEEKAEVVIEIADNGIGIEHKHLARIFERFYRADSARTRNIGGTGLGLAIVKHLCHHFNGKISVKSEPNVGTRFTIRFPLVRSGKTSDDPLVHS